MRVVYDGRQHSDLDNVAKAVLDALNGIAYNDDSQVHKLSTALDLEASDSGTVVQVKRL
jgi:Holliday junction resolvase RusA-like endonuclease